MATNFFPEIRSKITAKMVTGGIEKQCEELVYILLEQLNLF